MPNELDIEIAEGVMGWTQLKREDKLLFENKSTGHHPITPNRLPKYSEEIGFAMEVIEKMRADGWSVNITDDHSAATATWWVEFYRSDQKYYYEESASFDSLPLAICRAALLAVNTQRTGAENHGEEQR